MVKVADKEWLVRLAPFYALTARLTVWIDLACQPQKREKFDSGDLPYQVQVVSIGGCRAARWMRHVRLS